MFVEGIECPFCSEIIISSHGHHYMHCSCEYCFIDGGRNYTRFGWGGDPLLELAGVPRIVRVKLSDDNEPVLLRPKRESSGMFDSND